MKCGNCGQQNREGARFCDGCGARMGVADPESRETTARQCISCGKDINLGVYFTVCPHCGFNYRIEITPVQPVLMSSKRHTSFLYAVSIIVPMAGFIIGALVWKEHDARSRRMAHECVAIGVINIIITPILILRFLGIA